MTDPVALRRWLGHAVLRSAWGSRISWHTPVAAIRPLRRRNFSEAEAPAGRNPGDNVATPMMMMRCERQMKQMEPALDLPMLFGCEPYFKDSSPRSLFMTLEDTFENNAAGPRIEAPLSEDIP